MNVDIFIGGCAITIIVASTIVVFLCEWQERFTQKTKDLYYGYEKRKEEDERQNRLDS